MKPGPFAESTGEVDATGTASACLGDEAIATWTRADVLAELRATATYLDPGHAHIYRVMSQIAGSVGSAWRPTSARACPVPTSSPPRAPGA